MSFFASNIKYLRLKRGLKQSDIKGFNYSRWSNYENERSVPNLAEFIKICNFFGVTPTELLDMDLSKGEYEEKKKASKKAIKGDYDGEYNSEYSENLSLVNEDEKNPVIRHMMPHVITVDSAGEENVVMVPVRAMAGYLNGYADPKFIQKLPAYRLPGLNNGTYRIFEVEGNSMHPTLHGGDLVIGQNIDQLRDVRDDRVYIIVTKEDGVVVKRVLNRIVKDGKLILKSDNFKDRDLYPSIVCDPVDILEIWYATGFISRQLRPPSEMYNRVIDLEGRLTLLEDQLKKK